MQMHSVTCCCPRIYSQRSKRCIDPRRERGDLIRFKVDPDSYGRSEAATLLHEVLRRSAVSGEEFDTTIARRGDGIYQRESTDERSDDDGRHSRWLYGGKL